jgi:hypothetical protein
VTWEARGGFGDERDAFKPQSYQLMAECDGPKSSSQLTSLFDVGFEKGWKSRNNFSSTRLKLCIVKPFNLKTFMLHVMAAKVDAINYFNNISRTSMRGRYAP